MLDEAEAIARVKDLSIPLNERAKHHRKINKYYRGTCPIPRAVTASKLTKAYKALMDLSQTNFARLIVKAATSRLEIGGVKSSDGEADKSARSVWQANRMDGESKLAIKELLTHGRVFGICWPASDENDAPTMTFENSATVIVEYEEGSRHRRKAALRRWRDDKGRVHATLYTKDYLYKFSRPENGDDGSWEKRQPEGEEWPLPNPYDVVNVIEIAVNRELELGRFGGHAQGDFDHALSLMDRINTIEFVRLVLTFTSGFPIRVIIGNKILRDDHGNAIEPFSAAANVLGQLENPNARVDELTGNDPEAVSKSLALDIETLAGVTETPSYYMRSVPIQNVSADAIRAADGPLNGRVEDHKPQAGEGFEEFMRLSISQSATPLPIDAEVQWVNREARSLSERADAAVKLKDILPWPALAEYIFDASQEQIDRWATLRSFEDISLFNRAGAGTDSAPAG